MGPFVHALLRWYSLRHLSAVIPLNNGLIGILNADGEPALAGYRWGRLQSRVGHTAFFARKGLMFRKGSYISIEEISTSYVVRKSTRG